MLNYLCGKVVIFVFMKFDEIWEISVFLSHKLVLNYHVTIVTCVSSAHKIENNHSFLLLSLIGAYLL